MTGRRDVLSEQLAMNRDTVRALERRGVSPGSPLDVDYFYFAPGKSEAAALGELLRRETHYEVRVAAFGGGLLKKKKWAVTGTAPGVQMSQEQLDEWVSRMVAIGERAGCEFDGWGALAPRA